MVELVLGLAAASAMALVFLGLSGVLDSTVRQRLHRYGGAEEDEVPSAKGPAHGPMLRPLLGELGRPLLPRFSPTRAQQLRDSLTAAGNPNNLTVLEFLGLKLASCLVCGAIALSVSLVLSAALVAEWGLSVAAAIGGFFLPDLWLMLRSAHRQSEIQRHLPTVLDLLVMLLEAGMSLDNAIVMVCDRFDTALTSELRRYLYDVHVGRTRSQALSALAERTGVAEIRTMANAILQAEELGVELAPVLRAHAYNIRSIKRQRAQASARQAPVKMMFPLVFFIFPVLFILILGPTAIELLRGIR